MKKFLIILVVLGLAAGGGYYWWTRSRAPEPVKVLATAEVGEHTIRKLLEATGMIKTQVGATVKIGARATGEISQMHVKVGDPVEKGQVVALIDDREYSAQRDEAQARLDQAMAELERVMTVFPLRIMEARSQLKVSEANAGYLRKDLKRKKVLVEKKIEPMDTLDDALQDSEMVENEILVKKVTIQRLEAEFKKEAAKARRAVAQARAGLKSAEIRHSYTRIVSPITGVVSKVTAQKGETIVAGLQVANLITVMDPTLLELWVYVDESDVGQVRPGQTVEFYVDSYPDKMFESKVEIIHPEPEIRDNIVYYRALVNLTPEQSRFLRPEMTTQCRIVVRTVKDVVSVPNNAIKWVDGKRTVYLVDQAGAAKPAHPEFGLAGHEYTRVEKGLEPGQTVATQLVIPAGNSGGKKKKGR